MTDTFNNDQIVTPELGNEDLEQWLASMNDQDVSLPSLARTSLNATAQEQEGDEDDTTVDDDGEEEQETSPEASTDDYFTINGQQFARADIERLYEFDQYMRANPDAAQRVAQAIQPTAPAVPAQAQAETSEVEEWTEPTPPETLDLDDPIAKFTWDSTVSLQKSQYELAKQQREFFANQAAERQQQINRQAALDMDVALSDFRTQYPGLNDDDIALIRKDAGPFVPAMMQQLKPVDALRRSMEVAAFANTDLRSKLQSESPQPTAAHRSRTRKQKLGSVSGTPRSAPKVEARPVFTSDRDMVNAMASELADNMTGR